MKYEYFAQDELEVLDARKGETSKSNDDPVTITVKIELPKSKYEAAINKHKNHPIDRLLSFFK